MKAFCEDIEHSPHNWEIKKEGNNTIAIHLSSGRKNYLSGFSTDSQDLKNLREKLGISQEILEQTEAGWFKNFFRGSNNY